MKILPHGKNLSIPTYTTKLAACVDLYAAVEEDLVLKSYNRSVIPTGIELAIPMGYEAVIRPRSGLAIQYGVTVLNTPGTIDSDYRGEIGVILINTDKGDFIISRGMRIAQMAIQRLIDIEFNIVKELPTTKRSNGGFGSTGK